MAVDYPAPGMKPATLIAAMAGLVALGFPMIYVLWDALNHLLSGELGRIRWALVLPVLVVFVVYVYIVSRVVRRWDRPGEGTP